MSSSNCCFLTYLEVSQETVKVVWYSHLFLRIFQFVVTHRVKDFCVVNKEELDVFFLNSLAYSMIQQILAIWSLVCLSFLNPACTSGSSWFTYGCSLVWRILSITSLACEMKTITQYLEHSLALPFPWDWNENQPFPVLWSLLSFLNFLTYWVQHINSIIF